MLVGMDPSKRDQYAREKNLRSAFLAGKILDIAARNGARGFPDSEVDRGIGLVESLRSAY